MEFRGKDNGSPLCDPKSQRALEQGSISISSLKTPVTFSRPGSAIHRMNGLSRKLSLTRGSKSRESISIRERTSKAQVALFTFPPAESSSRRINSLSPNPNLTRAYPKPAGTIRATIDLHLRRNFPSPELSHSLPGRGISGRIDHHAGMNDWCCVRVACIGLRLKPESGWRNMEESLLSWVAARLACT